MRFPVKSTELMVNRKRKRPPHFRRAQKRRQEKVRLTEHEGTMFSPRFYETFRISKVTSIVGYLCPNFVRRHFKVIVAALCGLSYLALWFRTGQDRGCSGEQSDNDNNSEADEEHPFVPPLEDPPVPGKQAADSCNQGPDTESCDRPTTEEDEGEEFDSGEFVVENTDELYCGYDSTWECSSTCNSQWGHRPRAYGGATVSHYKFGRFKNAARDMQNYRHDYPSKQPRRTYWSNEQPGMPNLNFYLGEQPSSPDGIFIHEFHSDWNQSYDKLERVHTFIQWLFPLQEPGVNYQASELTKEEIKAFLDSSTAKKNLLASYKLMLDFYGIELCCEQTGKVKRAPNWKQRFFNLNHNTHNNLRITRILKCLGTLGFSHYQAPLVHFFLEETLVNGELPNVKESVLNYFMFAVLDKRKRRNLIKFAYMNYEPKEEFVWCPKKIQMIWSAKAGFPDSNQQMGMKTEHDSGDTYGHESTNSLWSKRSTSQPARRVDSSAKAQLPDMIIDLDQQSTPGSQLANPSLDYENQMSDDTRYRDEVKIDLPLPPNGAGSDLTAEKSPNTDEEPMDTTP